MKVLLFGLLILLSYSCRVSDPTLSAYIFPKTVELQSEKITINEILKPYDAVVLDSYIVVASEPGSNTDLFFVYSKDEFKFLYSFGTTGRGPREFLMPTIVSGSPDNSFRVFDSPTSKYYIYHIGQNEAEFVEEKLITRKGYVPFQNIGYVNDSIVLYNIIDQGGVRMHSLNLNNSEVIDTLQCVSGFEDKLGPNYSPTLDSYHFVTDGRDIVIGYRFIDEIYKTNLINDAHFEDSKIELAHEDRANFSADKQLMKNINYYIYTSLSGEYVFAQRYGKPLSELQPFNIRRNFRFDIHVFDRELNPVALLKFDKNMLKFLIDEDRKIIYTWDPLDNFNFIYKYSYEGVL